MLPGVEIEKSNQTQYAYQGIEQYCHGDGPWYALQCLDRAMIKVQQGGEHGRWSTVMDINPRPGAKDVALCIGTDVSMYSMCSAAVSLTRMPLQYGKLNLIVTSTFSATTGGRLPTQTKFHS